MRCGRPGCDGSIEDGYCDTCGFLAPAVSRQPEAQPASARTGSGSDPAGSPYLAGESARVSSTSATTGSVRATGQVSSRSSTRGHLGAGLVDVPPIPYQDPASVVMADPQVAENRRRCPIPSCDRPVGRSRDGRPGRAEGYCPHCGARFSFTPKLHPGDLVAGQYEVAGCLAYGGMGWVYLARDRNVSYRWVVLKGLLDSGDEAAMAAAIAERRFLAEVEHPNIVRIYNFVEHQGAGYIVMEYVGGQSLKQLRQGSGSPATPVPVAHAIAYLLESLPALAYLHARNLLYCDFKPDNVIQTEEQIKVIDLGGVRRMDADDSVDLYGTVGYQAPEVPRDGPSIASDLYTVARTLAVLVFDFRGFQDPGRYATSLPPASQVPVFQRYPGLYRFLQRAIRPDPARRFTSAGEMTEQLLGVLRQVVAIDGGRPAPAPSTVFTPDLGVDPDQPSWRVLPLPAVERSDPSAGVLATLAGAPPGQRLVALDGLPSTADVNFQRARAHVELGGWQHAAEIVVQQAAADPSDWRSWWWQAVLEMADGSAKDAAEDFDRVAAELPGELAPLLALATAVESDGDGPRAARLYDLVAATDPAHATASFGLARVRQAAGDRQGAAEALRRVPSTSSAYQAAQAALCTVLTRNDNGSRPGLDDLTAASDVLGRLSGDARLRALITRDLLASALDLAGTNGGTGAPVEIAGVPMEESALRAALERVCRSLAKLSSTETERVALVDEANSFRPRTWI
jgi:serine/threonine-protein kinase PknG